MSEGGVGGQGPGVGERCEFCGETEDLTRCAWPTMDFVALRVRDVRVGDLVRRFNDERKRKPAEVVEVDELAGTRRIVLAMPGKNRLGGDGPRCKVITESIYAAIRIKRDTSCGRACCWRCRVERGDRAIYCRDHWGLAEVAA